MALTNRITGESIASEQEHRTRTEDYRTSIEEDTRLNMLVLTLDKTREALDEYKKCTMSYSRTLTSLYEELRELIRQLGEKTEQLHTSDLTLTECMERILNEQARDYMEMTASAANTYDEYLRDISNQHMSDIDISVKKIRTVLDTAYDELSKARRTSFLLKISLIANAVGAASVLILAITRFF